MFLKLALRSARHSSLAVMLGGCSESQTVPPGRSTRAISLRAAGMSMYGTATLETAKLKESLRKGSCSPRPQTGGRGSRFIASVRASRLTSRPQVRWPAIMGDRTAPHPRSRTHARPLTAGVSLGGHGHGRTATQVCDLSSSAPELGLSGSDSNKLPYHQPCWA